VNLDKAGQAALLKLSELDLEIAQLRHEISKEMDSAELKSLSDQQITLAEKLLGARTEFENLETSVKRAEEDLRLVIERLNRDKDRLNNTSSPKDAIGIQGEIDSLTKRKDDLETIELGLLADLELAEANLKEIMTEKDSLSAKIDELRQSIQERVERLKVQGRKASADREVVIQKIPTDVLARYQVLAARQIAVGQVIDRACSACRMTLTVGAIDALGNLAEDQIGACPECQAIIVR